MSSDIGKVVINPQATSLDKDQPIFAFGEGGPKVVAAQDLPMVRATSVGLLDNHIKKFGELSASRLEGLTSDEKEDVQRRLDSLKNIGPDLNLDQQSMLLTAVNHINFALQNEGASQTFMLEQAKKTLEKLDFILSTYESSPVVDNSQKMETKAFHLSEFLKSFIAFLAQISPFKEKPSVEGQKSEPEPEPVPVPVLKPEPPVLSTSSPEFAAGKKAIFDKLNSAINTLPTDLQDVSYHEATEARYEETYEALKKELDQLRDSYELGVKRDDDHHPLAAEYNKLRTYGENIAARIAQLKNPQKAAPAELSEEDKAFKEAARRADRQGFKGQSRS